MVKIIKQNPPPKKCCRIENYKVLYGREILVKLHGDTSDHYKSLQIYCPGYGQHYQSSLFNI